VGASFPRTDPGLLAWSLNFSTRISAAPADYNLTALAASSYAEFHSAYASALAACDPNIRNKVAVVAKNSAKKLLKIQAQALANLIDGTLNVSAEQKTQLGLTVRKKAQPVQAPQCAPEVDVVNVNGTTVTVRLHKEALGRRGRPAGVIGAAIFSKVSETQPPMDPSQWHFEFNTGKTEFDTLFSDELPPGTKVWITAFWFNPNKTSGPGSMPVPATLNYASSISPVKMKLAA
jgi:hypothetical protein